MVSPNPGDSHRLYLEVWNLQSYFNIDLMFHCLRGKHLYYMHMHVHICAHLHVLLLMDFGSILNARILYVFMSVWISEK